MSHRPVETQERPLRTLKPEFVGTFDVVVSNPPYVLPKQYIDLPVTITHWESKTHMVAELMEKSKLWKDVGIHLDYAQQERWVSAVSTH